MSRVPTLSGKVFDYEHPVPSMIDIEDIAAGLSKDCRYAGQIPGFYSVAQHSLIGAQLIDPCFALEFLLHDAAEAYCRDVVSPHKRMMPVYREIEDRIDRVIRFKYNLPDEMSPEVKAMDDAMYYTERRDITPNFNREEWDDQQYKVGKALDYRIVPTDWFTAQQEFLSFYYSLTVEVWR